MKAYFIDRGPSGTGGIQYKVRVKESLRGRHKDWLTIFSENSSGRFPMELGLPYLLFVSPNKVEAFPKPVLVVDSCGHSDLLPKSTEVLKEIRRLAHKPAA